MIRARTLTALILAVAACLIVSGCDDDARPCSDLSNVSDCEAAGCEPQVAWLVQNGFAGPIVTCDVERFVQCHEPVGAPAQTWWAIPPGEGSCWEAVSPLPLPSDWTSCSVDPGAGRRNCP